MIKRNLLTILLTFISLIFSGNVFAQQPSGEVFISDQPAVVTQTAQAPQVSHVSRGNYRLRSGPSTSRKILGTLSKGEAIKILNCHERWCRVQAKGMTAWVHKNAIGTKSGLAAYESVDLTQRTGNLNFGSPVCDCRGTRGKPGCYLTSGFGPRRSRRTTNGRRMSRNHPGWDIGSSRRPSPVVAVESGYIKNVTKSVRYGYGRSLEVDHGKSGGKSYVTKYSHLSRIVKSSGWVNKGEIIGYTGATGNVTGIHLDIIFKVNGDPANPSQFLKSDSKWLSQTCEFARQNGLETSRQDGQGVEVSQ